MTDDFSHLPPELARVCRALDDLYQEISPRDYPKHSGMTIIYLERAEAALTAARQYRPDGVREALQWFIDRESTIQARFDLHGPQDIADAMREHVKKARTVLAEKEPKP